MHYIENCVQQKECKTYGMRVLFSNWISVSEYKEPAHKLLDFIAVGVGPLWDDDNYTARGNPSISLGGDL